MRHAAEMISRAGMVPGIWLAPFIVCEESPVAKAHPEWMLRNRDGELVKFRCSRPCAALDLSVSEVLDFIEEDKCLAGQKAMGRFHHGNHPDHIFGSIALLRDAFVFW